MGFARDDVPLSSIAGVDNIAASNIASIDDVEVPVGEVALVTNTIYRGATALLNIPVEAGLAGDVRVLWVTIDNNRYPNFTTADYDEVWRQQARSMGLALMISDVLVADGDFPATAVRAGDDSVQRMICHSIILRGVDPAHRFPSYNLGGTNTPVSGASFVAGPSDFTAKFLPMAFMAFDDGRSTGYSTLSGDFDQNHVFQRQGSTANNAVTSAIHWMDNNLDAGQNSGVTNFTLSVNDGVATCATGWQAI